MTKVCSKCGVEKELGEFGTYKKNDKIYTIGSCKKCQSEALKKWRIENKDKVKLQNERRKNKKAEWYRKDYSANKDKYIEAGEKYRQKKGAEYFREKHLARMTIVSNRNKKAKYQLKYQNNRYKTNINYKIRLCLATTMRQAVNNQGTYKTGKTMDLIGCSKEELKRYLEKQFTTGISWDNYGLYGWHIDHIRPCASFDLTDPEQQKLCFHYTNLQPLWAEDNLRKGDRWDG